jgi:hypothetical protein
VNDLSRLYGFSGIEKLTEDRHPRSDHVTLQADDYESQPKLRQIVLALNISVDCHKNIESSFGIGKELVVLATIPSQVDHRPDGMIRKRSADAGVDALV